MRFDTIYQPDPATTGNAQVDIIAIHGLNSSIKTWEAADGNMWLRDQLPKDRPDVRVLVATWDIGSALQGNKIPLALIANAGLESLKIKRAECPTRPIIAVAHSIGGVILKKMLVNAGRNPTYSEIKSSMTAIAFFGTPQRLPVVPTPTPVPTAFMTLGTVLTSYNPPTANILDAFDRTALAELHTVFSYQLFDYRYLTFYHTKNREVVPRAAACFDVPGVLEKQLPLCADHDEMCRFGMRSSEGRQNYMRVGGHLMELYNEAVEEKKDKALADEKKDGYPAEKKK